MHIENNFPKRADVYDLGLSMNILRGGGGGGGGMGNLLPAPRFLRVLCKFCDFAITFPVLEVTMIYRRATYFTDLEMIKFYQKNV